MLVLMWLAAILAGVVHVLIFCMESLWWTSAQVRVRFRQAPEQAAATRLFAFNQGFYNLFLAIGTFAGLALVLTGHASAGLTLVSWNCLSMLGAAIVLAASAPPLRRGAFIQGAAPLLFLLLSVVHAATYTKG
jgi:putative membrane protein